MGKHNINAVEGGEHLLAIQCEECTDATSTMTDLINSFLTGLCNITEAQKIANLPH